MICLKQCIPDDILAKLKLDTMNEEGESYVDDELKGLFSDIVYKVEFVDGHEGYISFLLEHKSTPEKKTVLQLLKYMTRIWDKKYKNEDKVLPLILPIVFYHGDTDWNMPVEFTGLMEGDLDWAEYFTPDFGFYLYTLEDMTANLSEIETAKLRIFVKLYSLNRSRTKEEFMRRFRDVWKEIGEYVARTGEVVTFTVGYRYVITTTPVSLATSDEITKEAKKITPERSDDMETIADELMERGEKRGLEKGLKEGRKEKLIEAVTKLLEKRTGKLNESLKKKIENSSEEELDKILENIFEIETVEDVEKFI